MMEEKTLEALKRSIDIWSARANDTYTWESECPLCILFRIPDEIAAEDVCKGCPVFEDTGQTGCNGTPYELWKHAKVGSEGEKTAATQEVEYLKSLLPEEK